MYRCVRYIGFHSLALQLLLWPLVVALETHVPHRTSFILFGLPLWWDQVSLGSFTQLINEQPNAIISSLEGFG